MTALHARTFPSVQAAIDAAYGDGGGTVHLSRGTWVTDPIVLRSGVHLSGEGRRATIVKLAAGANTHMVTLADPQTEDVGVHDLRLDGNKAQQTAGDVLHLVNTGYDNARPWPSGGDPNHTFRDLWVTNAKGHGVYTAGAYSQAQFRSVFSYDSDGNNFRLESPDNELDLCVSARAGLDGFSIAGNSNRVTGCKSWLSGRINAAQGSGFYIASVSRADLIGCEAQDNRQHGFALVNSRQSHIVGRADRNGLGPAAAGWGGDGVYAAGVTNSRVDLVVGDRNDAGKLMQRWAYNCGAGNDGNVVTLTVGQLAASAVGNGSWGPGSIVTGTFAGGFL